MTKKEEFENILGYGIKAKVLLTQIEDGEEYHYGNIQYDKTDYENRIDLTNLWQWIESELKQARIDELDREELGECIEWYKGFRDYKANRIKELNND